MMQGFPARYPGRCGDCGGQFDAGDQVGYNMAGELIHWDADSCSATVFDIRPIEEFCVRCFLIHPKGQCDYD